MSSLFGLFSRDGSPLAPAALKTMQGAFSTAAVERSDVWMERTAGLGCLLTFNTPEAHDEQLPRADPVTGLVISAAARLDYRSELCAALHVDAETRRAIPDSELILRAYQQWGEDCPNHLYGDWAFAIWNPGEQRLFLARDHQGNSALYYHCGPNFFAFASHPKALLALDTIPAALDELYLAQMLVSWPAYHGERTIYASLRRLPPAHKLTVTPDRLDVRRYWYLEHAPELHLPSREAYVEGFRSVFDDAVRARLRSARPVGVTLSGGLDSGAVAATAASILQERGVRLAALTSIPLSDTTAYVDAQRFGDEWHLAQATVHHAGNIDHHAVEGKQNNPLQAIHKALAIHCEPLHSAGNVYWMQDLFQMAQQQGLGTLLTGQLGNAGVSWGVEVAALPLAEQLRQLGRKRMIKAMIKQFVPARWLVARHLRTQPDDWYRRSAIHPEFARRMDLQRRMYEDSEYPYYIPRESPRRSRFRILQPGHSLLGALYAQNSAAYGLEIRDPTADARVLEFVIGVPNSFFFNPDTKQNRWLIRAAMAGRLPDEVRLNTRRGRQAGDLVPRLRVIADEIDETLNALMAGRAKEYVDVPYLREVWQAIRTQDTPEIYAKSVTIFTRGLMAGLFTNQFGEHLHSQGYPG